MKWFNKEEKPPAEWIAKYWQSIVSLPRDKNALATGEVITENKDFISLPCTGGGEACDRGVTLTGDDAKKPILVPVLTAITSTALGRGENDKELLQRAKDVTLAPEYMEVSLDGMKLKPQYVETKESFEVQTPVNHMLEGAWDRYPRVRRTSCCYDLHMHMPDLLRFASPNNHLCNRW